MSRDGVDEPVPLQVKTPAEWRRWLVRNHSSSDGVWLILRKKSAPGPGVLYEDALDEAVCFGWIDGKLLSHDGGSFLLRFSPRRPKSIWSKGNKERAQRLLKAGRMHGSGLASVRQVKASGAWANAYVIAEELALPRDLRAALMRDQGAWANFNGFSRSSRNMYIRWVTDARKPETRKSRIEKVVGNSALNKKPG